MALEDEDRTMLEGFVETGKSMKNDESATKEAMEGVMKEIEEKLNKMYEKYGGAWNSDAATENPGEHVIEADDVVEPTEEK